MSTPTRRAPECPSPSTVGGSPNEKGSTNAPAEGRSPTKPAPAPSPARSVARQLPQSPQQQPEQPQQAARSGRAAIRALAALPAAPLSAAEQQQRLEEQQVADVAAELKRLQISYASASQDDLFAGVQLHLQPETLEHLKALKPVALERLPDVEGEGGYPEGLQGILQGTVRRARLSRQPLLGRPSLLVRAACATSQDWACGSLAGRLTEAPEGTEEGPAPHQHIISKEDIHECAKEWGGKYRGPNLLLDMSQSANEFRFLADTALRLEEGNVVLGMYLVRDAKQDLALPLLVVVATKDLQKGEELLVEGDRETARDAPEEAAAARKAAKAAAKKLERLQEAADKAAATAATAKGEQEAAGAAEAATKAEKAKKAAKKAEKAATVAKEAATVAAAQFQGKVLEQLLQSGWRQHTLDVFFQRHAELAAKLASSKRKDSKLQQLKAALAAAVERYYGGSSGEASKEEEEKANGSSGSKPNEGGCGGKGGDSDSGSGSDSGDSDESDADAAALRELQAALEDSLLRHPPPLSTQQLSKRLTLKPSKQFNPCASFDRPLQQHSDFVALKPETIKKLDGLKGKPEELPKGCRERLDSGAAFPGIQVCEVAARLHRVRLLTPPNCRALSLHAPPKGKQLQPGECACMYVGKAYERGQEADPDSAYLFDVTAADIAAASGSDYSGPDLVADAGQHWNEAAFANCVFGSELDRNLQPKVVWDAEHKRPHVALVYTGEQDSQPSEELLLDYTFDSYWKVQVAKARQAHEQYATLAGEVILSLRQALKEAGAPDKELGGCLRPVDLAKDHQEYVRVGAA